MKKALIVVLILAFWAALAGAQGWRPLETREEARQRHTAERYETYKSRGYQAPLGGYSERLGDPAPWGAERPGFVTPGQGRPSLYGPSQGQGGRGFGSVEED